MSACLVRNFFDPRARCVKPLANGNPSLLTTSQSTNANPHHPGVSDALSDLNDAATMLSFRFWLLVGGSNARLPVLVIGMWK